MKTRALIIAACFGLSFGIAEAIYDWLASIRPDGLGWRNDLIPEILWISPVFDLFLFLSIALAILIVSRFWSRLTPDVCVYFVLGWLAVFGILSASGRLHPVACVVLALGTAVQLRRYANSRWALSTISAIRLLLGLVLIVVLMNLWETGTRFGQASPAAPKNSLASHNAPNILLITLDTLRADHVSAYGYSRQTTPNLDAVAREGVLFENAFATASWTLPSHASMMTGRYLYEHRAGGRPLGKEFPTLAEALTSLGYVSAGFIANNEYCSAKTGLDRGFSTYQDYFSNVTDMAWRTYYGKVILSGLPLIGSYDYPGRKPASEINREFFTWLETHRSVPFFAFLNYFDVHDPYIPRGSQQKRFVTQLSKGNLINSLLFPRDFTGGRNLSVQEIQAEKDAYDDCLSNLDMQIGLLIDRLRSLSLLDKTLLIITSDHGESFGDHGFYGHGNNLYRNLVHVPLIMRYPDKVPVGLRAREAVSLQAIPASVMNLIGFSSRSPFSGAPLSEQWSKKVGSNGDNKYLAFAESLKGLLHNPAYPLGRRGITKSLTSSKWNLILHEEGDIELFEVDRDPEQLHNLANTAEAQTVIKEFAPALKNLMPSEDWSLFCRFIGACDSR